MKCINDLFPYKFHHRDEITSIQPLRFKSDDWFSKYDIFRCIRNNNLYKIQSDNHNGYGWCNMSTHKPDDLEIGDIVYYVSAYIASNPWEYVLCELLNRKDYFHTCDLLYDISMWYSEIPDELFRYVLQVTNGHE